VTRLARRAVSSIALLAAAFGASLVISGPATAATAATIGNRSMEGSISLIINRKRAAAGCGALITDDRLRVVARKHSADMIAHNFFGHTSFNGATFATRITAVGYTRGYGENISWGYRTPTAVVDAWMNSAPHRANILNCSFNYVGVGAAFKADGTPYWTQDFGRR
jgi:uncharacterized protein YkwD